MSADPVMPTKMQSSSLVELVGPLGPVGTLLPGEDGPGLCPIGLTFGLWLVAAVPLPAGRDPMIALSPVEGLEMDCAEVGEESITVHGGWSGPDVAKTPVVVAMVGMDTLPMGYDAPLDYVDGCPAWDSGYQRKIIDGMTVYYGGDLCDSDCLAYSVSVAKVFPGLPLVWGISANVSWGVLSDRSLFLSTFVLGGGGSVVIRRYYLVCMGQSGDRCFERYGQQ